MTDLIDLAQKAFQQSDWSLLTQLLQQRLLDTPLSKPPDTLNQPPAQRQTDQWLEFAMAILGQGDFQERWDVAKVFPGFGTSAIAPLVALLQNEDEDPECRWFAARLLGELNDPIALRSLVELLHQSTDEDLNQVAVGALASLGVPAVQFLVELLHAPETRLLAVQALVQIHSAEIVAPLLSVAGDSQSLIRELAIAALGSFPDPQIPPLLVRSLTDPVAAVRRLAIMGLAVRPDLIPELDLITKLTDRLVDVDLSVCQQAALALGRLRDDEAVPVLLRSLYSPQTPASLQVDIIRALGWIGSQPALDVFQGVLQPESSFPLEVYQELVATTGRWESAALKPRATQVLVDALHTKPSLENADLRRAIALGLGQLQQPEAIAPLVQLLADEDGGVRWHAIAALKKLDVIAHLYLKNLQSQPDLPESLRQGVANALQEWQIELPR